MASEIDKIDGKEIDDILDEIEAKEETQSLINWNEVKNKIISSEMAYLKTLISSNTVNIDEKDQEGKTLLIYCAISGKFDMVRSLCSFGADISIKDKSNHTALDYARKYGYYRIAELLYFASLSGSVGGELKEKAELMYEKRQQTLFLLKHVDQNGKLSVIEYMVEAIQSISPFSDDLMLLAWDLNLRQVKKMNAQWNSTKLWKEMMLTFESILKNTQNANGWEWLKKYFVTSNIWLLPHPQHDDKTLFHELLIRTQAENQRQGELLLTNKIRSIKKTDKQNWDDLVGFDVKSDLIEYQNVRQDADIFRNSIKATYTQEQLSKYPQTATFNAMNHVNLNLYLQQLLFHANIIDEQFQLAVKDITDQILSSKELFKNTADVDQRIVYKRGPVKAGARSRAKVQVEYNTEKDARFPTAARLLDLNRCAIEFDDICELLIFLKQFTWIIKGATNNATCIKHIVRCKNGWSVFDEANPNYCDIKLNVLISYNGIDLIGEIQFLLSIMSQYKKKAHKLYSISRKQEFIDNYLNLQNSLSSFANVEGRDDLYLLNAVLCNLCKKNELLCFQEIKKVNKESRFKSALELESEIDGLSPIHHLTIAHYGESQPQQPQEGLYQLVHDEYNELFKDKTSNKSLLMTSVINGNINYLVAVKKQIDQDLFFKMLFEKDNDSKTSLIYAAQYAQAQCKNFIMNNLRAFGQINEENGKLVKAYTEHRDKDNKTALDWSNEVMHNYVYLSSYGGFQLQAYNCKGTHLGAIMSSFDGISDDDEETVKNNEFDEDSDNWITGFAVDKYGNLYVASYEGFLYKYLPNRDGKLYRNQCPVFRGNIDTMVEEMKLEDGAPEGVTTINDYKYDCILVSVMTPINGVMQLSLNGELLRIVAQGCGINDAWSLKTLPYHFKDKIFNLDNNKRYFMVEGGNRLYVVDLDTDTIKHTIYCRERAVDGGDSNAAVDEEKDFQIGDFCFLENGYGESILCINLQEGIVEFRSVDDGFVFDIIHRIDLNRALSSAKIENRIETAFGFTVGPDGLFYLADTSNSRILRFKFVNDIHSKDKKQIDYAKDIHVEVFAEDVDNPNYTTWFNSKIFT